MQILDPNNLKHILKKLKNFFAQKVHTHTSSEITDFPKVPTKTSDLQNDSGFKTTDNNTTYTIAKNGSSVVLTGSDGQSSSADITIAVDSSLSSSSTNPVQNKVINSALSDKVPNTRKINNKTLTTDISLTASDVGAAPVSHNTSTEAHNDIRLLISGLSDRLNALANSDDVDLDQMKEVVAYIKENRTLIESVTTNKVNVADIVNNLTTNVSNKPLSAAQGVAIKALIDALQTSVNSKASSSDLTTHAANNTHITAAERTSWTAASSHASSTHAPSNAEANQNAWSNIAVGNTTIAADTKTDTLTIAGNNVTLTPDATNDKLTIGLTKANVVAALGFDPSTSSGGYTHPTHTAHTGVPEDNQTPGFGGTFSVSQPISDEMGHITAINSRTVTIPSTTATDSAAGLMSAADKTKLEGIASGANKTTVDSALSSSSTNPVQNKVINEALNGKAPSSHVGDSSHITAAERTSWAAAASHAGSAHAPSDAQKNQNAFSKVVAGSTTIEADSPTDTLTLEAGSNITITPDTTNDKITIAATDTVYTLPTASPSTLGGVKTTSTVTSTSGLTACPIISGVPYYKNTTYSSLKNPYSLTIQGNGSTLTNGTYDGSEAKTVNITPEGIGAAPSGHSHSEYMPSNPYAIELKGSANPAHGGYIDFHYKNSTEDFTTRIIENSSGKLYIQTKDASGNTITSEIIATNNTTWKNVVQDSGWTSITLASGFSETDKGGNRPLAYRKIGSRVYITGSVSFTASDSAVTVFTIPEGYRPKQGVVLWAPASSRFARIQMYTNGQFKIDAVYDQSGTKITSGIIEWCSLQMDYFID